MTEDEHIATQAELLREENNLHLLHIEQLQAELQSYRQDSEHRSRGQGLASEHAHEAEASDRFREFEIRQEQSARRQLEAERNALLSSTSWRISAPLRWMRNPTASRSSASPTVRPDAYSTVKEERAARRRVEREIKDLLASTSWRVTAPIRWRPFSGGRLVARVRELETKLSAVKADLARVVWERQELRLSCNELRLTLREGSNPRRLAQQETAHAAAVARWRAELHDRDAKLASVQSELENRQKQAEHLQRELDMRNAELRDRDAELAEARSNAEVDQNKIEALQRELEMRDAEQSARDAELVEARSNAEVDQNKIEALQRELEVRGAEQRARDAELAEARSRTEAGQQQLDRLERELERLHGKLTVAETSMEQRGADLEQARNDLSIAVRQQTLRDHDLKDLQARYAASLELQEQQKELLVRLTHSLGAVVGYPSDLADPLQQPGDQLRSPSRPDTSQLPNDQSPSPTGSGEVLIP